MIEFKKSAELGKEKLNRILPFEIRVISSHSATEIFNSNTCNLATRYFKFMPGFAWWEVSVAGFQPILHRAVLCLLKSFCYKNQRYMSTKNTRQDALRQLRDGTPTPHTTFSGVEIPRDLLSNPINCN